MAAVIGALVLAGASQAAADDNSHAIYIVSIRHIDMAPDQKVGQFRINLGCARILSMSEVPWDWRLSMDNVTNCETYVYGGVYHGSGMIEEAEMRAFTLRVIKHEIKILDRTFSLSGQVSVTRDFGETERLVDLNPSDFRVEQAR